jgi:hypothetical protein
MSCTIHSHSTVGVTAAAARLRVREQLGLGYGWQTVASPCMDSAFTMAIVTNKRQAPRRLGQRTT